MTSFSPVVQSLLESEEPSVRWKVLVNVLGERPDSPRAVKLREEIMTSIRVRTLLADRDKAGRVVSGRDVYGKWQGAHWVMATLADIGYPPGDASLFPVRDQLQDLWLSDEFYDEFIPKSRAAAYSRRAVPVIDGRHRTHPSQQGNALYAIVTLGLEDERTPQIVERILHWQWPDGGWNCDKNPSADTSSFMESLTPLRGLVAYGKSHTDAAVTRAIRRAAEIFLERKMFRRRSDGEIMNPEYVKLHYPLYWHYDFLGGLKVMAEAGFTGDPRCEDAVGELMKKRLPDGGWPAESRYYRHSKTTESGAELVDWGGTSKRRMNEWVTADALFVLKAFGMATEL